MPGTVQTVPRAELFAICVICMYALSPVVIHSDAADVVRGCQEGRTTGENSDLWGLLASLRAARQLDLSVQWVKAHGVEHPEYIDKYRLLPLLIYGHVVAYIFADKAAERAEIGLADASTYWRTCRETQEVQKRLVAILAIVIAKSEALAAGSQPSEPEDRTAVADPPYSPLLGVGQQS